MNVVMVSAYSYDSEQEDENTPEMDLEDPRLMQ